MIASIGDMYFVHQRGTRVAFQNFIQNSASSLASIICGQVFAKLGWLWLFHMFQVGYAPRLQLKRCANKLCTDLPRDPVCVDVPLLSRNDLST